MFVMVCYKSTNMHKIISHSPPPQSPQSPQSPHPPNPPKPPNNLKLHLRINIVLHAISNKRKKMKHFSQYNNGVFNVPFDNEICGI